MLTNGGGNADRLRDLEAENARLRKELERLQAENRRWARMAGTDALTGLPNKISFMRALVPQTLERAVKEELPVGLILFCADNLGSINEAHGREAGDQVLKELAGMLQPLLGPESRVGHIDGAHFAVLLYPCDVDTARGRANMLRARVRTREFPCGDTTAQITVSAGVACVLPEGEANGRALGEEAFRSLSHALHAAKRAGGNRIEVAEGTEGDGEGSAP